MGVAATKSRTKATDLRGLGCEEAMASWVGELSVTAAPSVANSSRRRAERLLRNALVRRGEDCRSSWPQLLAMRVELVSMTTSPERTEDDEPVYIDYGFEILLNDPARSRLVLPVRVTAEEAAAPGYFDDAERMPVSPDYHWKAWYALCRFSRALSEMVNAPEGEGGFNTPRSRWASEVQTW